MVDKALSDYVKAQLASGYSAQEVKTYLLQKGYAEEDIDYSLKTAYSSAKKPTHKNPLPLLIILLLIIGIIAGVAYFLFFPPNERLEEASLKSSLFFDKSSFKKTDAVAFRLQLENTGERTSFPVKVMFSVTDSSGKQVHAFSDSIVLIDSLTRAESFKLQSPKAGSYFLSANVSYEGKSDFQTASFLLQEETNPAVETCFDNKKNQDETGIDCGGSCKACIRQCPIFFDDKDPCTTDKCGKDTNYLVIHEPITPCCGNMVCESTESKDTCMKDCASPVISLNNNSQINDTSRIEIIETETPLIDQVEAIKELAYSDPKKAESMCAEIVFPYYRDECYYGIAEATNVETYCSQIQEERSVDKCLAKLSKLKEDSSLCATITNDVRRDSCYMRFAMKGDYTVCDKIMDDFYIQTCRQLQDLGKMNPDAVAENAKICSDC
jgi:hypothetical protein